VKKRLILVMLVLAVAPGPLLAQTTGLSGFDLRLFRPPADGGGILNIHGSRTLARWQFHVGSVSDTANGLLVATNPTAGQSVAVVEDLFVDNFLFAIGLTDFFQAGLVIPTIYFEEGANFNTGNRFITASFGDVALELKLRLLKGEGALPGLALASITTFPSGDTGKFTGYSNVTHEAKLIVDKKIGPVSLAVNAGYRVLERTQVVNLDIDDMITYGGGFAWTLPFGMGGLDFLAEVDGATVARNRTELTSPLQWLVGLRQRIFEGLTLDVGGGRGITNSVPGNDWRVVAGLHFTSRRPGEREEEPIRLETIYFRFNQDKIQKKYEKKLDVVAEYAKSQKRIRMKVRGHADGEGTEEYNQELSRRRAENVANALEARGVKRKGMTVEAIGSREPAAENRTRQGKAKNRRVEILEIP
jgi:outer membrane protein OmpA-like peptidoglycan-associated protein